MCLWWCIINQPPKLLVIWKHNIQLIRLDNEKRNPNAMLLVYILPCILYYQNILLHIKSTTMKYAISCQQQPRGTYVMFIKYLDCMKRPSVSTCDDAHSMMRLCNNPFLKSYIKQYMNTIRFNEVISMWTLGGIISMKYTLFWEVNYLQGDLHLDFPVCEKQMYLV